MDGETRTRASRRVLAVLAVITLIAFALRWPAVHRMLPQVTEPDAFLVLHAQQLDGDPALVRHWEFGERYPMLLTRLLEAVPRREPAVGLSADARERDALACAAAPYVHGRILVLLFGIALVPLTWLVALRFVGPMAALIAAWLVATSFLHALFSTQARPHVPQTTLAVLAVWGALRVAERPGTRRIIVAAILASLSIACLQSGLFTLFPLAMSLLLGGGSLLARLVRAAVVPLCAALAAFWAYPVLPHVDATGFHMGGAGSHDFLYRQFNFHGLSVAASWFLGHDPLLCVMTLLGLACAVPWLARHAGELFGGKRPALAIVLAYVVPYFALVCVSEEIYERFLLPLLPWCAVLAAWAWWPFVTYGTGSRLARNATWTVRLLAGAALLLPLAPLVQMARVSQHPDTLEETTAWIRAHVPPADRLVGSPYLSLPALFDAQAIDAMRGDRSAESNPWISWQMAHPEVSGTLKLTLLPTQLAGPQKDASVFDAWIAGQAPRWIVLETSRRMEIVPGVQRLRAWAEAHGEAVFDAPGVAPEALERGLVDYQAIDDAARRMLGTRAFGMPIRVWKITH